VTTSPTTSFPEEEGYDDNNTSILGDDSDEYDSSLIMTSKDSKKCKLESLRVQLLEERINVAVQLADALAYLHDQNVLHRDLKPDNIGFDKDGNLKVFDFDIARVAPISMNEDELFHMTQKVGSPRYMSPECAKREPYNKKADVYSYGLLFHQIMTLEKPYDDIDDEDHEECVFYEHARPHMIDVPMPQTVKNMIQTTWSANIRKRPTMKNVQNIMHEQRNELLRFGTTTTPEDSSSLSKKSAITTPSAAYVTSCAFHSMSDNNPKYKKMIKMMMKKSSNYSKRNVALHHNSSRSSGSHRPLFRRFAKAA
jgi:serine/threonine protein kinase